MTSGGWLSVGDLQAAFTGSISDRRIGLPLRDNLRQPVYLVL